MADPPDAPGDPFQAIANIYPDDPGDVGRGWVAPLEVERPAPAAPVDDDRRRLTRCGFVVAFYVGGVLLLLCGFIYFVSILLSNNAVEPPTPGKPEIRNVWTNNRKYIKYDETYASQSLEGQYFAMNIWNQRAENIKVDIATSDQWYGAWFWSPAWSNPAWTQQEFQLDAKDTTNLGGVAYLFFPQEVSDMRRTVVLKFGSTTCEITIYYDAGVELSTNYCYPHVTLWYDGACLSVNVVVPVTKLA